MSNYHAVKSEWISDTYQKIRTLLPTLPREFTADDLWGKIEYPVEPRWLGIVMVRLAHAGHISRKKGEFRPSVRRHDAPLAVWVRPMSDAEIVEEMVVIANDGLSYPHPSDAWRATAALLREAGRV